MSDIVASHPAEPFTFKASRAGALIGWPFFVSSGITGLVMGVTYRGLGFDLADAVLLSATIFSGTAQAVTAAQFAVSPLPFVPMLLAVMAINARYLLMSAHLRRLFPDMRLRTMLPSLFFLVDGAWVITTVEAQAGRRDMGFLVGAAVPMYVGWVAGTLVGHLLDFAPSGPIAAAAAFTPLGFIIAMVPSQWKGRSSLPSWSVTAAVSLLSLAVLPGTWAVLLGALVGTLTTLLERSR
jgi:predicted branched-subunit amino acid permease